LNGFLLIRPIDKGTF